MRLLVLLLVNTWCSEPSGCWQPTPNMMLCGGEGEADVVFDENGERMLRPELTEDDR